MATLASGWFQLTIHHSIAIETSSETPRLRSLDLRRLRKRFHITEHCVLRRGELLIGPLVILEEVCDCSRWVCFEILIQAVHLVLYVDN
ncbi:hypothetical protein K1719_022533 [Acacia pycnantha]|nr:hypothetical protein K1719_022533 [Acacia pycnantha]